MGFIPENLEIHPKTSTDDVFFWFRSGGEALPRTSPVSVSLSDTSFYLVQERA
jgi:hypothetical protein